MKPNSNTIYVRHSYDTDKPLAVANTYDDLEKIKGKKGQAIYIREYAMVEEGQILCERKHCEEPHYHFCPSCGFRLPFTQEELSRL